MEHDIDDPPNQDLDNWWWLNRLAEEFMRYARMFGFLAALIILGLPQFAKAQEVGHGIVCDTPEQVIRFVLADDSQATLAAINQEKAQSCALLEISFYTGSIDSTVVTRDGVWEVTHILIVGIATPHGISPVEPTPQWTAIAVPSKSA